MPTPTQHAQEQLSRAYIRAVAAEARVEYQWKNDPDYGIDGAFRLLSTNPAGNLFPNTVPAEFQLKASTKAISSGNKILYDLDVATYNNLLAYHANVGGIFLLLYVMPAQPNWVTWTASDLVLRTCCYYWIPSGSPSNNSRTKRIKIPTAQTVSPSSLPRLIRTVTP